MFARFFFGSPIYLFKFPSEPRSYPGRTIYECTVFALCIMHKVMQCMWVWFCVKWVRLTHNVWDLRALSTGKGIPSYLWQEKQKSRKMIESKWVFWRFSGLYQGLLCLLLKSACIEFGYTLSAQLYNYLPTTQPITKIFFLSIRNIHYMWQPSMVILLKWSTWLMKELVSTSKIIMR